MTPPIPHFSPWLCHGNRFVFVDALPVGSSSWSLRSAQVETLEGQALVDGIEMISTRLAEEAMDLALMGDCRLISEIDEDLVEGAFLEIRGKIVNMLRNGASALHNIDQGHNEDVKRLVRVFAREIAQAVCENYVEKGHVRRLEGVNGELSIKANIDFLTGLPNRAALEKRLQEEVSRADRTKEPCSLLMFDLDHFKEVNDQHGHPVGDEVLRRLADLFLNGEIGSRIMRESDFVARYGGDEIVFILPNTNKENAIFAAHRIVEVLENELMLIDNGHGTLIKADVGASIGIGIFGGKENDPTGKNMFSDADQCLLTLKGEKPDRKGVKTPHRGQVAAEGEVFTHEMIEEMIRQKESK